MLKNERKLLKFIRDNDELNINEICDKLNINSDENFKTFRHLENMSWVVCIRKPGRVGYLNIESDPISITSNGIIYLDEWLSKKITSYAPIIISVFALQVSIISLLRI